MTRADAALPYPLPEGWRVNDKQLTLGWPAVLWAVIEVGVAVAMVAANISGDVAGGIIRATILAAVGAGLGVSYQRSGAERGLPTLLNAVVLSRAQVRPPDSWIHFFREAGPSRWMTVWFTTAGTLSSASLIHTAVTAVRQGAGGWLWLIVPLLLLTLILALAGWITVVQAIRHATFSHRHLGISIGRHGVIRYYLDAVDIWPWQSIATVEAVGHVIDKENNDFTAKLVIVPTARPDDVTLDEYSVWGYQSHAWLIYTAVRFWAEHPEHRDELGTTFAQRRIEAWRDAMLPTRAGSALPS